MALAGELAKYIGNELVNTGSKALAKAGATSTLSSLVPKVATDVATKTALGGILPSAAKSASDSMMTLYRGLTQKYDPKYPVAKLDTSGYESWTDNPELARQYGDYVYSIDVPKTDIKDSYLDENPNSPTYGDRNPIYGIDKKAGLNGISGKEYLLEVGSDYQKGLTYNEVPGEVEMAIKNSGVGSDAVKRAEGYLGGTMLDKSGKPITFYHSTPNEFSKFDDARLGENTGYDNTALGHFVTTDKDFSKRFIDINNTGKTGRTMELRAKIQKPITHPYMAGQKYDEKELDKIVEDYLIATNNQENLDSLREFAEEDGTSLYDAYMDLTVGGDSPFEYAADDRKALLDNGYDAVEIVEGPKSGLVDGSNDDSIVSSYAVLNGDNLVPVRHIPVQQDNYVPLYHQTSANSLADFSLDKRKAIGADYGTPEGIFLKDTNADIGLPGKNQLRLDAKMNNPATFENREALAKYMGDRNPKYTALVNELDEINDTYDDYLMDYMAERGMNPEDYLDFDTAMDSVDKYIEDRAKEARDMISTQLKKDGYDGAIINSDTGSNGRSVKSYVVMGKDQLRDSSVPVKFAKKSSGKPTSNPDIYNNVHNIPVNKSVMDKVAKYLKSPTDAKLPAGYSNLISKAKNYKSLDRFEKMNNPIKGSEIWGEKPKSYFERDSRAVRINMFPNEAVKGSGITKQYLLNLFKDAYDQGITDIVPSYGSYTKEGASFMDHLAEQGWVKDTSKNGWKSYEISPKIAEWEKTSPLADIYNEAHNVAEGKNFRPTDANADGVINWNDVKAVYNQAKQQQAELDKMGRAIAEKEGFPEYTDFSPKSIASMENKVKRKGGDYSLVSMKDHTRNKIMMNSWEDVPKVISDMEQMGLSPDVEFVLNDWGYKGLHITGRFDNGLGWEIQLTTPEDWPRKLKSDAIYDKWRNTQLDTASPKEVMGYLNAMRESKAMWSESKIPDLSMYDNVTGR